MKKLRKITTKILAVLAAIAVIATSFIKVDAAAQQITLGPGKQSGKYIAGVSFSYKMTTDGQYLYCIDMHRNTAQNIVADLVSNSKAVNGGIVYILKNGYPEKSITGDADKDYYITQTAIWWYLDETTGSQNLGDYFKVSGSDSYNMRHYVKSLVDAGIAHKNDSYGISDSSFKITTADTDLQLEGNYYVSNSIYLSEHKNITSYTVSLSGAPSGTLIEVANNHINSTSTTITGNDSFRIKVPASKVTESLSIKVTAKATTNTMYSANEYQPRDKTMQNVVLLEKSKKNHTSALTLHIEQASKVSITKIDSYTKKPLAGAVLVLKDSSGREITRWTSTTNAHVVKNLANGTYTVEEVSAPNGYAISKEKETFKITNSNKNVQVEFENTPNEVVVNITKVDQATQEALPGAVLVIKDENGEIVYKFTTTNTSEIITDIEYGTYTLEEVSAPDGYIKSDKVITFTIDEDHLSQQIIFENAREVYVPNTASIPSIIMIILGIVTTGFGLKFVYKNGQKVR